MAVHEIAFHGVNFSQESCRQSKGAEGKLRIKRAMNKLRWLEKNCFLSGQDRLLGEELGGP